MAQSVTEIAARIATLEEALAEATKPNLEGGAQVSQRDNVGYCKELREQIKFNLMLLQRQGYELDDNGDPVACYGVKTSQGVVLP